MLFAPLFILCIAAIVGVALVAMLGGGGASSEHITKERMARRADRSAATDNVTALPTADPADQPRHDAAA